MKKKIKNSADLYTEIIRLKQVSAEQEKTLKQGLKELKEEFEPHNILVNFVSKLTGINIGKEDFFRSGFKAGLGIVLNRFLYNKEALFEKQVYKWIDAAFVKLETLMMRFTGKTSRGVDHERDA